MSAPFRKILIANRGEIACRIHRTAARMGVSTVAVYSDADREALHTRTLDEAIHIGPAPARASYLVVERLLEAARRSGAEAIHPGYGFLSENAEFAVAVEAAGLVFIGPPPAAIRAMGSKSAAKALMAAAKVPIVPGYHGDAQDDATLEREGRRIGTPLLIKAVMGGGGKGMRRVDDIARLGEAVASARREAEAAFGNGALLIERYVERPRHIEVQVFADAHGNVVHLFERDCSIQRRHQKIIEEAPAPGLSPRTREKLYAAAIAAARAVGYCSAGTIEFIAEAAKPDRFYFMEMNTRLQVEHPVTEAITGLDLVEWQLRVAAGERLPLAQSEIRASGHAVEVRICAEDPAREFLPVSGTLLDWSAPSGVGLRLDAGVETGSEVAIHYDSMLAKLIAHAPDRARAIDLLAKGLGEMRIAGVVTNREALLRLLDHASFREGEVDTGLIARHPELLGNAAPPSARALALVALGDHLARPPRGLSPWDTTDGFEIAGPRALHQHYEIAGEDVVIGLTVSGHAISIATPGQQFAARSLRLTPDGRIEAEIDGMRARAHWHSDGDWRWLACGSERLRIRSLGPHGRPPIPKGEAGRSGGRVLAPMPGRVGRVLVEAGGTVAEGETMLVLEAMKMEHSLRAPIAGTVAAIHVRAGEMVAEGTEVAMVVART